LSEISLQSFTPESNQITSSRSYKMKLILLAFSVISFAFTTSAQYKDSLKVYRKLTKSYQKSSDFVFIPSEVYSRGVSDYNPTVPGSVYLRSLSVKVDSFFIEKYEVSNRKYLEFVNDAISKDSILGRTYLPDTLVWRRESSYNEPYVDYYLRHPAYADYPVVGVSYNQATAFAEWYTSTFNSNPNRVFKQVLFRIPTESEWEVAFKGGQSYSFLPWGTNSTLDENGKPRAHFRVISQLTLHRDSVVINYTLGLKKRPIYISDGRTMSEEAQRFDISNVTLPVKALEPNGYGLYHMAGNVEEMVDAHYFRDSTTYSFSHDVNPEYDQPWGVVKGGSWDDPGYYLQYPVREFYDGRNFSSDQMGFRLVMEVLDF